MADKTIETTLFACKRTGASVNGNPKFELTTRHGTFKTQSDAACAYDVENIGRKIPSNGDGLAVVLTMTKAERVWRIDVPSMNAERSAAARKIIEGL